MKKETKETYAKKVAKTLLCAGKASMEIPCRGIFYQQEIPEKLQTQKKKIN